MLEIDVESASERSSIEWAWASTSLRRLMLCLLAYMALAGCIAPGALAVFFNHYASELLAYLPLISSSLIIVALVPLLRGEDRARLRRHIVGRLAFMTVLSLAMLAAFASFTTIKFSIPALVPFYADAWAAEFDATIHGSDPWVFAHAVWPESWSGFMFRVYSNVWFVYWLATPFFVALWTRPGVVKRYLWALLLTFVICGSLLAMLMSSVGPIFYNDLVGGDRFDGLITRLNELDGMRGTLAYAGYLLDSYNSGTAVFGTGISAIPSMHVAVATLNALLFSSLNRWAGLAAWAFAALIMFGSVYTGWHYAIDGYLSAITVTIIWVVVRRAHLGELFVSSTAKR